MPRQNRRGRYYNYPNLRANNREVVDTASELHAMGEITQPQGEQVTYENNQVPQDATAPRMNTTVGNQETTNTSNTGNQTSTRTTSNQGARDQMSDEDSCRIRFFNAAAGYGALDINVGGIVVSNNLLFGLATDYVQVPDGFQQTTITMVQDPEAVLLNKRMPFRNCMNTTAAIINTSTGIELMMINDEGCRMDEEDRACFRVGNLSYTSPSLDIVLENGNPVFEDVRFKYVTEYKQAVPGEYNFNVMLARTAETLKNNTVDIIMPESPQDEGGYPGEVENAFTYFFEDFEEGERYTAYIIGNKDYDPPLRVVTLEEEDD